MEDGEEIAISITSPDLVDYASLVRERAAVREAPIMQCQVRTAIQFLILDSFPVGTRRPSLERKSLV